MASYCSCDLNIRSENPRSLDAINALLDPKKPGLLLRIRNELCRSKPGDQSTGLLEYCRAMPTELRATITNGWSGPTPKWYSWCVDNWGCAYEPAIESIGRPSPNELQLSFETRYAPPLAALTHGAKLHAFEYRLVYCDASNLFAGIATQESLEEFEFSFDVHPRDEGVPEELITLFDLENRYHQSQED